MRRNLLLNRLWRAAQRAFQHPDMRPLAPPVWRNTKEPGTAAAVIAAWSGQDFLPLGNSVEHDGSMTQN
jgi:hypothetical protein